jgi:hypothetical protein
MRMPFAGSSKRALHRPFGITFIRAALVSFVAGRHRRAAVACPCRS